MIPMIPPAPIVAVYKDVKQINFQRTQKLLGSHKIWSNFGEISDIYRESGHNQQISLYLVKRLKKAGFDVKVKKGDGTICATRGLNSAQNNAVILQSHMDVVAISKDGDPKKPIKMHLKNGWLHANERTLGADNGVGMSAMLTVAEDTKFKKYPLEMIFTTDEETGMNGARLLKPEDFHGKYLINLDSEEYGEIIKGCAGISQFSVKEKIKMIPLKESGYKKIQIKLAGARGGHSAEVTPESLNPIKILISEIKDIKNLKLVSLSGGERYNAVPRDATAEFFIPATEEKQIKTEIENNLAELKKKHLSKNKDLNYSIKSQDAQLETKYIEAGFQQKMFKALDDVSSGLLTKFEDNDCNKTSQNLGTIKVSDGNFEVEIMGRSSDKKEGQELQESTSKILSQLFEKQITPVDSTPIWEPQKASILEDAAVKAYSNVSGGKKPTVKIEHGGLESAIFMQTRPDIEQISIGPTIKEPHSIQERIKVNTVLPFYNWLSQILQQLANK